MSTTESCTELTAPFQTADELATRIEGMSPEDRVESLRKVIFDFFVRSFYRAGLEKGKAKSREAIIGLPVSEGVAEALGLTIDSGSDEILEIAQRAKSALMGAEVALTGRSDSCSDFKTFLTAVVVQSVCEETIDSANAASKRVSELVPSLTDDETLASFSAWEKDLYEAAQRSSFLGRCHGGLIPTQNHIKMLESKSELDDNQQKQLANAKKVASLIESLLEKGYEAAVASAPKLDDEIED